MQEDTIIHIPVLLNEVISGLDLKEGNIALDCTTNKASHGKEILSRIGKNGLLIGIDEDGNALSIAKKVLEKTGNHFILEKSNFRNLDLVLKKHNIEKVDKILFDLGISSDQLELSGRGFSFKKDEPLLMTLSNEDRDLNAFSVVNTYSEKDLAEIIFLYGEERRSRKIAKYIVEKRKKERIKTSKELREAIEEALNIKENSFFKIHPATKTFQAIRIYVNDELEAIKEGLMKASLYLNTGGIIAAISFHSGEDRIVKNFFKEIAKNNDWKILTKKPIEPSEEEIRKNPRSRSAKLRIIKKII